MTNDKLPMDPNRMEHKQTHKKPHDVIKQVCGFGRWYLGEQAGPHFGQAIVACLTFQQDW